MNNKKIVTKQIDLKGKEEQPIAVYELLIDLQKTKLTELTDENKILKELVIELTEAVIH